MSDAAQADLTPPVAGGEPAPAAAAAAPVEAAKPVDAGAPVLAGTEGAAPAADPAAQPVTAEWPEDWRDRIVAKYPAADREKAKARLSRFQSPENVFRSYTDLERKVQSGMLKASLPEGATPDEVKAYRAANGIPEAPDGYGLAFPETLPVSETDKADLAAFAGMMHEQHAPPAVVKKAFESYLDLRTKAMQDFQAKAHEATISRRAELKAEYGPEFDRNIRLANNALSQHLGDRAPELMQAQLSDGTRLGDHPDFVRFAVAAAMATADDATLIATEFGGGGKSVEDQYREGLALLNTDPKAYWGETHQAKMAKLSAAMAKRRAA